MQGEKMTMPFKSKDKVLEYAARYEYDGDDILAERLLSARKRGYLTKADLFAVVRWMGIPRLVPKLDNNSDEEIREISRASFSAVTDRLRVGALVVLEGVEMRTASVILHFAFPDEYPIASDPTIEAVGVAMRKLDKDFSQWLAYTELCKRSAFHFDVSLRVLDRALGEYGKQKGNMPNAEVSAR